MKSDQMEKKLDEFSEMEFIIDIEERETTVRMIIFESFEDFAEMMNSHMVDNEPFSPDIPFDYTVSKVGGTMDNSMGGFLLYFIQADFSNVDGFTKFIDNWGISGLLGINLGFDYPLISEGLHYSTQEVKEFYQKYFEGTHKQLLEAQSDFRKVIDYCTDVSGRPFLEPLKPQQRYYIGTYKGEIPSLDKYSGPHKVLYTLAPKYQSGVLSHRLPIDQYSREFADANARLTTSYFGFDFRTFVYLEFFTLINELLLKKCSNCGSYFVAKIKTNEIYCENCRNVSYSEKVKKDPLQKAYHTAYKTKHREKHRKIQISPDNKAWIEKWENLLIVWVKNAKEQLELVRNEEITLEEFKKRLNVTLSEIGGD